MLVGGSEIGPGAKLAGCWEDDVDGGGGIIAIGTLALIEETPSPLLRPSSMIGIDILLLRMGELGALPTLFSMPRLSGTESFFERASCTKQVS